MSPTAGRIQEWRQRTWPRIFLGGLALWVATVVVTMVTANANLVPTLVLLGSFLVPIVFVAWAFERWQDERVTARLVITAFVVGGLLGVLGASVLESYLLHPSPLLFVGVGLIEEAAKLAALVVISRKLPEYLVRDGIVLGAAVGFGFAAFESAGYAFNAVLTVHGLSLRALVETEILRSVIAPVGHGLWTAILGGVLFGAARGSRFRLTPAVLLTFVWVALLHALWDSMHNIAVALTYLLTQTPRQHRALSSGYLPSPTSEQVHLFTVLSIGGLVLVSILGVATLLTLWRRAAGSESR